MLHPNDDLFACGVVEPASSATVCSVVGIDDLIILGVVVAASVAASQISAGENESASNDRLDQQQKNQWRAQQINFYKNQQDKAAASIASRHGGHGGESSSQELQPWADKLAVQNNFDLARQDVARQADMQRTQGWINGGTMLAQGLASGALRPAAGAAVAGAGSLSNGFDETGQGIASRAGGYDLPQTPSVGSPVQTAPIRAADPMGGFQLQDSDYATLGGAGQYSQGPFADDPYATANPYQNPNRYRFTL